MTTREAPHFWIVDPVGHRTIEKANPPEQPDWADTIINLTELLPADSWTCDRCNRAIDIVHKVMIEDLDGHSICFCGRSDCTLTGQPVPVPISGPHALCLMCYFEEGPELWDENMGCGCEACLAQAAKWAADQEGTSNDTDQTP